MPDFERSTVPGAVMATIGVVILLAMAVWMTLVGFYPSQAPIIIVMFIVGGALAWLGQRTYQSAKRENALRTIKQRDARKV